MERTDSNTPVRIVWGKLFYRWELELKKSFFGKLWGFFCEFLTSFRGMRLRYSLWCTGKRCRGFCFFIGGLSERFQKWTGSSSTLKTTLCFLLLNRISNISPFHRHNPSPYSSVRILTSSATFTSRHCGRVGEERGKKK